MLVKDIIADLKSRPDDFTLNVDQLTDHGKNRIYNITYLKSYQIKPFNDFISYGPKLKRSVTRWMSKQPETL